VLKRGLLPAVIAALLLFPPVAGAETTLVSGVTYKRLHLVVGGRPVVLHVVRTPPDGGLYQLRPVLSNGDVLGRQTVAAMQRATARRATSVGINGDFFTLATGQPVGVFLRDGVLSRPSTSGRSAVAIGFDGRLIVDRFRSSARWWAGPGTVHHLEQLNRPIDPPGAGLFTPKYGGRTPKARHAFEAVLAGFPPVLLNGELTGGVTAVRRGGGTRVPPGGAVIQARGTARAALRAEAPVGTQVSVRLRIPDLPDDVGDALGGGPLLVRDGVPVRPVDEFFTSVQILERQPRTAVGQRTDGSLLFVVADGRSSRSYGLTNWQLATTMANLGAVTAMGFDGGGSSTLAFDGLVLNRPSDGAPRRVANALMLQYLGIYAPKAGNSVLSPNGDGVGDRKVVAAKIVRRSSVDLRLLRPDGTVAWRHTGTVRRGWIRHGIGSRRMPEGTWRWSVEATEVQSGSRSSMRRPFRVNRTLGFLRLSRDRARVARLRRSPLRVSLVLAHRAHLSVKVLSSSGRLRRVLFHGDMRRGRHAWRWNGRDAKGKPVGRRTYAIEATATNRLGTVALADTVRLVRAG
jgi:hypothetical protein